MVAVQRKLQEAGPTLVLVRRGNVLSGAGFFHSDRILVGKEGRSGNMIDTGYGRAPLRVGRALRRVMVTTSPWFTIRVGSRYCSGPVAAGTAPSGYSVAVGSTDVVLPNGEIEVRAGHAAAGRGRSAHGADNIRIGTG
jgi:hypothetical protein